MLIKSIKIFNKKIKIIPKKFKKKLFGKYEQHEFVIKVNEKYLDNPESIKSTIFHEAIHAALHIGGLSDVLNEDGNNSLEEAIVVCIENAFAHAIDLEKLK